MAPTIEERMAMLERKVVALQLRALDEDTRSAARSRGGVDPRVAALEQRVEKLAREVSDLAFELRSAVR